MAATVLAYCFYGLFNDVKKIQEWSATFTGSIFSMRRITKLPQVSPIPYTSSVISSFCVCWHLFFLSSSASHYLISRALHSHKESHEAYHRGIEECTFRVRCLVLAHPSVKNAVQVVLMLCSDLLLCASSHCLHSLLHSFETKYSMVRIYSRQM